jgi:lysophospholipase L1-like esterase
MKRPLMQFAHHHQWLLIVALATLFSTLQAQEPKPVSNPPVAAATAAQPAEEETEAPRAPKLDCAWLPFPDAAKFKVLGLWWFEENKPQLWRMPAGQFDSLPKGVTRQARQPSGGRILFQCDTANLGLKVLPANKANLRGFDVYVNGKFVKSTYAEEPKVEAELVLFRDLDRKQKEIMIYLPSNQGVLVKGIGVDRDTKFSTPGHQFAKPQPVVFYGSSVCQGNGALKPGMTFPAKLCRDLNLDFINLGFGGAGKAEPKVVELVSSIPACCYIFDLGKSYGMQDGTAFKKMLQAVRKAHPDAPLICMTPITSAREVYSESYANRSQHTREAMRQATAEFIQSGEKNVILLEGTDLLGFGEHDGLSRDGVHPTDYGYSIIAGKLVGPVKKALGL